MFCSNEHYMSISHMAIFVYMATQHLPGAVAPDRVLSMGQIEQNWVLMLNWIVWNRPVFDILNSVLMLKLIVWNWTVFGIETDNLAHNNQ